MCREPCIICAPYTRLKINFLNSCRCLVLDFTEVEDSVDLCLYRFGCSLCYEFLAIINSHLDSYTTFEFLRSNRDVVSLILGKVLICIVMVCIALYPSTVLGF